ncbi:MAG: peptidoglycan-binding protein [Rhizobiaceae bacterium]
MNAKRSYLETLNAGRQRRVHASIEELSRSVDGLGRRLDDSLEAGGSRRGPAKAPREEYWAQTDMAFEPRTNKAPGGSRNDRHDASSYQSIAREIDKARKQDEGLASAAKIASELKALRDELRHQMSSGLRREFESLRKDIQRAYPTAPAARGSELGVEFERLSDAVQALSSKGDDKGITLLRLELEQLKSAFDSVAREETVRAVGSKWDDLDRRWSKIEDRIDRQSASSDDPAIDALSVRLEQISDAVNNLPESLSLRSLEDKVRMLAGALDQFARKQEDHGSGILGLIEERLDEISRAIVASAASVQAPQFDPEPFERVEARITSLARQIEELVEDRPSETLYANIESLARRVDEIAERGKVPERLLERFAVQITDIAERLDAGQQAPDAELILNGIEKRFDSLSDMLDRRQGDAIEQGHALFRDLEQRLDQVAARLDARPQGAVTDTAAIMDTIDQRFAELARRVEERAAKSGTSDAIQQIEIRLDDISARLDAAPGMGSIDGQIVRRLEEQVAEMTRALARSAAPAAELEEIAPRLDDIEKSINDSRASVLEAARDAAASAVRSLAASSPESAAAAAALARDLKSLDTLTRQSEERNTKTFEAIHDTLLKVVDRLTALELTPQPTSRRGMVEADESFGRSAGDAVDVLHAETPSRRSPAEAAAAAAVAALGHEETGDAAGEGRVRSMLGGISRAFSKKEREEPVLAGSMLREPSIEVQSPLDEPIDPAVANRPLEPGSGTPDLNAIIRRVREERASPASDAEAAKSDFIAAARRAAQAAAAEAGIGRKGVEVGAPGGKTRISDILRSRRKPILMGAVAILVALAGLQLGKAFFRDDAPARVAATTVPAPIEDKRAAADPIADEKPADEPEDEAVRMIGVPEDQPLDSMEPDDAVDLEVPAESVDPAPSNEAVAAIQTPPAATFEEPAPVDAGPVALREAADAGDAKAMFEIGSRYAEGRGVTSDMAAAAKWYERSAGHGFAPAQYRIGNFYEKGIGAPRDIAKAKTWYQLSAEQGNASAMHNLAVLFAMGADGNSDNESASRWFIRAAELGVKDSQFNLGILAAKGVGMEQNLEESYKWFALVAKTGDKDAAAKRDEVANALRPDQLTRARAAVELWKPKPVDAAANSVDIPDAWKESSGTTAAIDMKQAVRNIQGILNKNGYDAGNPDGLMGSRTKSAIAAFQADNGMEATGEVDEKLVRTLLEKK